MNIKKAHKFFRSIICHLWFPPNSQRFRESRFISEDFEIYYGNKVLEAEDGIVIWFFVCKAMLFEKRGILDGRAIHCTISEVKRECFFEENIDIVDVLERICGVRIKGKGIPCLDINAIVSDVYMGVFESFRISQDSKIEVVIDKYFFDLVRMFFAVRFCFSEYRALDSKNARKIYELSKFMANLCIPVEEIRYFLGISDNKDQKFVSKLIKDSLQKINQITGSNAIFGVMQGNFYLNVGENHGQTE